MSGQAGRGAADEEALVASFVAVTSATREEAQFFLESYEWRLDPAVAAFFDDQPQERQEGNNEVGVGAEEEGEEEVGGGMKGGSEDEEYVPSDNEDAGDEEKRGRRRGAGSRRKRKAGEPSRRSSAVTTFSDLKKCRRRDPRAESETDSDGSDSDSGSGSDFGADTDSDEDQDYYAGGEKRGSSRKRTSIISVDDRIYYKAPQSKSKSNSFTGKGRLLSEGTPSSAAQQTDNITYNIYFWRNGFTVDNGPLRRFDDPQNSEFLASINHYSFPEELKPSVGSAEVRVIRRLTNYSTQASCPSHKRSMRNGAFRGTGRTVGTEPEQVPDTITDVPASVPTPASNDIPGFRVDDSLPITSLQIRLLDGTRLVGRFNTSNTISDLRAFIDASRPSGTAPVGSYQLQTVGFPPKPLNDGSKTIEEEGIANSVVIQKA